MFPSASAAASSRATRSILVVALIAVLVAAAAVHTDAAAAAAAATAGRLASRLSLARPAAAVPGAPHALTEAQADRRFKTQWAWRYRPGYPADRTAAFPACTSELTGATHAVISEEQWSRIDFNPTNDDQSCRSDGGFINEDNGSVSVATCQAKCKDGYANAATGQLTGGISKFQCAYSFANYDSINEAGTLSGGPVCSALLVVGLAEGQATEAGQTVNFHLALENSATVESDLVIAVSCTAAHTLSAASLTIPATTSQSTDITITIGNNNGGSCTFTYTSGDPRFAGWTKTINFNGPTLTPSLTEGSTVLAGSVNNLVLTASSAVSGSLTANVRCADSANAEVGTLNPTTFSFSSGNTAKALVYTMPSQLAVASVAVTCKFTAVVSSDARYNNFAVPDLVFTVARPTLTVSYNNEVINTNSPTTLTLTASAPPTAPLTVTPTCSAGTVNPATFVINSGASTATLTFTTPAVKTSVICTFALSAPGDARFAGSEIAPLTIAVDLPIAITLAAANPFIPGVNPVTLLFSRAVVGTVNMFFNTTMSGASVTANDGESSAKSNFVAGQPGDWTYRTFWTYISNSQDTRYEGITVYLEPHPVVAAADMTMTPSSAATASVALIGGRQSEMSVTISYAAYGSLLVTPECKDGATVVGSFSPARVSFVDGATVASVNYTAPTSNVASLICSFTYESGDYRYDGRSASLAMPQVLMPTITLTGLVNGSALIGGDSLFVGDEVALLVTVDPAPNGALTLTASRGGVAVDSRTVDSGATAAQKAITVTEAGSSSWSFAYQSGDDRFAGISSNSLAFSAVLTTLTLSGVTNGSSVTASSPLLINVIASHAVRDEELVVAVSCSGVALVESMRLRVGAVQSTVGTTVNLPAAAATPTTVSCALSYDRGDARYSYASAPSFFVVVPAAEPAQSSSSTGDSGSSTGTGTGTGTATSTGGDSEGASSSTGKNQCDDIECAATAQAHSGFAFLALAAAAAAFALNH